MARDQLLDQPDWLNIRRAQAPDGGAPISGPDSSAHV